MTNFERTATWLAACGKKPNVQDVSTQIGCHLEEVAELLQVLRVDSDGWQRVLERAVTDLHDLAHEIKSGRRVGHIPQHLRMAALDALCDSEVTGNGIAYLSRMDKAEADRRVLDSNDSKLEGGKPVLLPGGKIGKGKDYQEPDLKGLA